MLLDGVETAAYDLTSLRQAIGVVPQKAVLFKGTIRQNLLWGNASATDDELWEALTVAQAKEVVEGKDNGLDAPVEQGGRQLLRRSAPASHHCPCSGAEAPHPDSGR